MITAQMLRTEQNALKNDSVLYLECMNNKRLTERKTEQEIRDGCILFWHVYTRIITPKITPKYTCTDCEGSGQDFDSENCPTCDGKGTI